MTTFTNPYERIEQLQMRVEALEAALRKITATTYGSELSMSPEEHNEYFAQFYRQYRDIARAALAGSPSRPQQRDPRDMS